MKHEYSSHLADGTSPSPEQVAAEDVATGVPLVWPDDIDARRKLFWKWCKFAKRRLETFAALKCAIILESEFMVTELDMSRSNNFLATEFNVEKRTMQRGFNELRHEGWLRSIVRHEPAKAGKIYTERLWTLCIPISLFAEFEAFKADSRGDKPDTGVVTNLTPPHVKSVTTPHDKSVTTTPKERTPKEEPMERKQDTPSGGFDFDKAEEWLDELLWRLPFCESYVEKHGGSGDDPDQRFNTAAKAWIKKRWLATDFDPDQDTEAEYKAMNPKLKKWLREQLKSRLEEIDYSV